MKIKLNWLKELIDLEGLSLDEIVNIASLYSSEIEAVDYIAQGSDLVVARVLTCVPHPDSDHLHVCTVDDGKEVLDIVCGAPNVCAGAKVILAHCGCKLIGGTISPSKIRGVASNGMLCSLQELGVEAKFVPEEFKNGIYLFKEDDNELPLGTNALDALMLGDPVLEMAVTPNRGDLNSMIGVAIELSASLHRPLKGIAKDVFEAKVPNFSTKAEDLDAIDKALKIEIDTPKCPLYMGLIAKDVVIKPSPKWMQTVLIGAGIRPINNVVDITNYIMTLFGQPLHSFDYDKAGHKILVREAKNGEVIRTLDGQDRALEEGDIVITNGEAITALGGVMGGEATEITETTQNVLIEGAIFDSLSIRRTAVRLNLRSEAEGRYEHGVDQSRTALALAYTKYLLETLADAKVLPSVAYCGKTKLEPVKISLTEDQVENYLGIHISKNEITDILTSLGFSVDGDIVSVPSRRPDIKIYQDLIEEVARIYGYDKIPATLPAADGIGHLSTAQKARRKVEYTLNDLGIDQVITYSLVSEKECMEFVPEPCKIEPVKVLMPLTKDHEYLRMSLIPSLVNNAEYLMNHKMDSVQIFEHGNVFGKMGDEFKEEEHLAILLSGPFGGTEWRGDKLNSDFYMLKGILETLSTVLGAGFTFEPSDIENSCMHPRRTAKIMYHNKPIGFVGDIHPRYVKERGINPCVVAEILLKPVLEQKEKVAIYKPINTAPMVNFDIAVIVKKDVLAADIIKTIKRADKQLLTDAKIFDVYEGLPLPADMKSIAVTLTFSAKETLTDQVINEHVKLITEKLKKDLNATLRQ